MIFKNVQWKWHVFIEKEKQRSPRIVTYEILLLLFYLYLCEWSKAGVYNASRNLNEKSRFLLCMYGIRILVINSKAARIHEVI